MPRCSGAENYDKPGKNALASPDYDCFWFFAFSESVGAADAIAIEGSSESVILRQSRSKTSKHSVDGARPA